MSIRQPLIIVVLLFVLFSCKEKGKNADKPAPVSKDTISPDSLKNPNADLAVNPYTSIDISPMDMSYYPVDYPKLKMANKDVPPPVARVIYSRPHLGGRKLFHDVLQYGENWRLGANEATEIDFYREVTIDNKKVKPGRYVLYCVLGADKWTMVLNSNIDSWGLKQDSTKDVFRFDMPVTHNNPELEFFTMVFEKTSTGADLVMAWDDVLARMPIGF
jgi:hypothetical protein